MNDYWLSRSSEVEAQLENLRIEYDVAVKKYQQRIVELERTLLEANCNIIIASTNNATTGS
jgi:hypothetical protein